MNKSDFIKLLDLMKGDHDRTRELYRLGIDKINYDVDGQIQTILGRAAFGEEWEMVTWFCYEKDFGKRADITARDKDGNEICKDVDGLWEWLEAKGSRKGALFGRKGIFER